MLSSTAHTSLRCLLLVPPTNPTVMEIDAVGTFQMSRCAFPQLRKSPGASIINISATLHYGATWYQVLARGLGFRETQGTFEVGLHPFEVGLQSSAADGHCAKYSYWVIKHVRHLQHMQRAGHAQLVAL